MRRALLTGCGVGAVLGLLAARPAAAQTGRVPRLVLKTNVFQPLVRGYHLELEKNWRTRPRYSLGLTLQGYYGAVTELTSRHALSPGERVRGGGLELLPRCYLPGRTPELLSGFYVAAGPHVQHFRLHFQDKGWVKQLNEDALPVYAYVPLNYVETITRYGVAAVAGYQGPLELGPLFLDFYLGLGWRAVRSRSALPDSRYRTSLVDYGTGGLYFPLGFKLGVRL